MPRKAAYAQAAPPPPPPTQPVPIVRPTRQALLAQALRLTRDYGPPGSDRDIERTALIVADKLDACWDFWSEAG